MITSNKYGYNILHFINIDAGIYDSTSYNICSGVLHSKLSFSSQLYKKIKNKKFL